MFNEYMLALEVVTLSPTKRAMTVLFFCCSSAMGRLEARIGPLQLMLLD